MKTHIPGRIGNWKRNHKEQTKDVYQHRIGKESVLHHKILEKSEIRFHSKRESTRRSDESQRDNTK